MAREAGDTKLNGRRRARRYDFHRPDKFSRENLGALRVLHDSMARLLATSLSAHVRTAIKVSLVALDQVTYEEFVDRMSTPVILGLATFSPLEGKVGIELCPSIAYPLLERLLGNPQEVEVVRRSLTDIEAAVIQSAFERVVAGIADAWRSVRELGGQLETVEASPFFTQFAPPNEMMMAASFLVDMGEHQGRINIAWPYMMLEPILSDLSVQHWMVRSGSRGGARDDNGAERDALEAHLRDVRMSVVAQLGTARVTLGELLRLEPGDVIRLATRVDEPIGVCVGDRRVFVGRPGRVGRRLAVQVIESETGEG